MRRREVSDGGAVNSKASRTPAVLAAFAIVLIGALAFALMHHVSPGVSDAETFRCTTRRRFRQRHRRHSQFEKTSSPVTLARSCHPYRSGANLLITGSDSSRFMDSSNPTSVKVPGGDSTVRFWNLTTGAQTAEIRAGLSSNKNSWPVHGLALSMDRKRLAVCTGIGAATWKSQGIDLASGRSVRRATF